MSENRFEFVFENYLGEDMSLSVPRVAQRAHKCPIVLLDLEDDIEINLSEEAAETLLAALPAALKALKEARAYAESLEEENA